MDDKIRRDRKYKSFWGVFLMASVMLAFERLSGDQWVMVTMAVFATYGAANVGEFFIKKK